MIIYEVVKERGTMYNEEFQEFLTSQRINKRALASMAGISFQSLLQVLNGKSEFSLTTMKAIADVFQATLEDFAILFDLMDEKDRIPYQEELAGKNLDQLIKYRKLRGGAFAKLADTSYSSFYYWRKHGLQNVKFSSVVKIAKGLNINLDQLYDQATDKTKTGMGINVRKIKESD